MQLRQNYCRCLVVRKANKKSNEVLPDHLILLRQKKRHKGFCSEEITERLNWLADQSSDSDASRQQSRSMGSLWRGGTNLRLLTKQSQEVKSPEAGKKATLLYLKRFVLFREGSAGWGSLCKNQWVQPVCVAKLYSSYSSLQEQNLSSTVTLNVEL